MTDKNPRGERRPRDGRGRGIGMSGGQRSGRHMKPCSGSGPGFSKGAGRGKGRNRSVRG